MTQPPLITPAPHHNPADEALYALLDSAHVIAVVGASPKAERSSNGVFKYLLDAGYTVIPVNPNAREVHGQRAYSSLAEIRQKVDIVNVFRRSEDTPPVAEDAAAIGARALWLQQGIFSSAAADIAAAGGAACVMDNCIAVTHRLLRIPPKITPQP